MSAFKKDRQYYKFCAYGFLKNLRFYDAFLKAIKDYIQPILLQVTFMIPLMSTWDGKRKSGLVIGVSYFFIFLLTSWASKNAGRFTQLKIRNIPLQTLLTGLFAGALCGWLMHLEYWILALLSFVLIYLIENLRKPILTGTLADQIPNKVLTSVFSAQSSYQTILTSTIAILLGYLADHFGIGIALLSISLVFIGFNLLVKIK